MKHAMTLLLIGIVIAGCAVSVPNHKQPDRNTDQLSIVGKTWQWESTLTPAKKTGVAEPERYTIQLMADGRVQATFDCNRGGGSYTMEEGKLSFGPMMSTRMACPPDSLDALFMKDLQRVTSFFVEEGRLYLELPYDSGTMRFREASASKQADTPAADTIKIHGTVVHNELEGGFFAIESDDGRVYDPVNLPDGFKKHGLKVKVTATLKNDMGGIHMVGDIIEIVDIAAE